MQNTANSVISAANTAAEVTSAMPSIKVDSVKAKVAVPVEPGGCRVLMGG